VSPAGRATAEGATGTRKAHPDIMRAILVALSPGTMIHSGRVSLQVLGVARPARARRGVNHWSIMAWPNRYDGSGVPGSLVGAQLTLPVLRRRR
jgi:hypothetical protein